MKIKQDLPQFTPITITLETREEAEALWLALRNVEYVGAVPVRDRLICGEMSNWFSNESRL
jgi:hypothetical protein